jgi:hypothetical protein
LLEVCLGRFSFIGWAMASELIAAMAVKKEERSTKWFEEE